MQLKSKIRLRFTPIRPKWPRLLLWVGLVNFLMAQSSMDLVLPKPKDTKQTLDACISKRRSVRSYKSSELTIEQISNLLWSCQGITDTIREFRAAPSAGATFPLEVLVAKKDGLFRYAPLPHKLIKLSNKDKRAELRAACLDQEFIAEAPAVFIFSAIYARTTHRYGERGKMYVHIEVGHAAQNLHLMAVALGLSSVPVGAFDDEMVKKVLDLPKNEEPLYVIPVGYQK